MKKMPKRTLFIVTATVATMTLGGVALAHRGGGGRGGGGGFGAMKLFGLVQRLDLTEEQEVKAVRIRRMMREERKTHRKEMKDDMLRIKAELSKSNPDPQVLHQAADQAMDRMRASTHKVIDRYLELHGTLTPEQLDELSAIMNEAEDRMQRRRERKERRREQRQRRREQRQR